jgi:hypothetical protein
METQDLFQSPADHLSRFSDMQVQLYRHNKELQDYFLQLQMNTLMSGRPISANRRATNPTAKWAIQVADRVSQARRPQKIKTEILFCPIPYFARKTENRFLVRTLLGLAQTGASILCLLPGYAPFREELDAQLAAAGRSKQVTFLDPTAHLNPVEGRLRPIAARMRGRAAFEETVQILEPHGLSPSRALISGFEFTADFVEAWERMAPWIEFDAVVARCHWQTLCSPVCRTGLQRGKPVITFQQGVIGHTLDVPVAASKFVAFGQPSASFLNRANHRFFQAAGLPEPPVEYVNGGCLFDTLTILPDQFELQTLLLVDVPVEPGDFYGIEAQCQALLQLAETLLSADSPLRRLVIRPHPYWSNLDLEMCQQLVRDYPNRCELSHPAWSLEDDLRRSSVVVGILSGALTVASACGLPTIFLQTEGGYMTGDLACFSPDQTLSPNDALLQVTRLLTNRHAYAEARTLALRNGRGYYANRDNPDFSGPFFERLLRSGPMSSKN